MIVNKKKTIKQLMAIGVQRNDAAAFARAYRKIMDAKMEGLFPEIVKPVMPVMGTAINYRVIPFRAAYTATEMQMAFFRENYKEFELNIKNELSVELAKCLMESGAITMRIEQICGVGTQYTATVRVSMPGSGHYA